MFIARMQPGDRDALDTIARVTDSDVNFDNELARAWARVWVARKSPSDRDPLGFLLAWAVADELHLINLAVHPDQRRLGAGSALVRTLVEHASAERVRLVLLEVRRSNRAAIRLYRAHGFTAMGIRRRYYADNSEDAIEMMLALDPKTGECLRGRDEIQSFEA
jgi:ribosomal-protein-alanine N-acetyltransferase